MHAAAYDFVARHMPATSSVLEFGGRNINGTVRDTAQGAEWWALDLVEGPGVDEVADAHSYKPARKVEVVVCCEVAEHDPEWRELVASAARCLKVGGTFILTAACDPRAPHSAVDGGEVRPGEYYANIDPDELGKACEKAGLTVSVLDVDTTAGDVRLVAERGRK